MSDPLQRWVSDQLHGVVGFSDKVRKGKRNVWDRHVTCALVLRIACWITKGRFSSMVTAWYSMTGRCVCFPALAIKPPVVGDAHVICGCVCVRTRAYMCVFVGMCLCAHVCSCTSVHCVVVRVCVCMCVCVCKDVHACVCVCACVVGLMHAVCTVRVTSSFDITATGQVHGQQCQACEIGRSIAGWLGCF